MEHEQHFGSPRPDAPITDKMLHNGLIVHGLPWLIQQGISIFSKAVDVTRFRSCDATRCDALLVGGQHRSGCDVSKMVHQTAPNCIGRQNRDLLADNGSHKGLKQIITACYAVWAKSLHGWSKEFILKQKGVSIVPPCWNPPAHAPIRGDEVLNPCVEATPCEKNS